MKNENLVDLKEKVAITGNSGFIGTKLNQRLTNARVMDINKHRLEETETLKTFLKDVKIIFHLAGINAGSGYSPTNKSMTINNVIATRNLMDGVRRFCCEKPLIVLLSTIHVYSPEEDVYTENSEIGPPTYYGLTKLAQELIIQEAAKNGVVDYCIFRGSNIYGAGCRPNYNSAVATFIDRIEKNEALELFGNGDSQLDLIYIDDVINVLIKAGERPQFKNDVYNLSCGRSVSIKKVVNILGVVMQTQPKVKLVNTVPVKLIVNNSKLIRALGTYEFIYPQKGLEMTLKTNRVKPSQAVAYNKLKT